MLLDVTKVTEVTAGPAEAWALVRDVPRLARCIPGVSDLRMTEADRTFAAVVEDRLGPFRIRVPLTIELRSVEAPHRLSAALVGNEAAGQARVRGTLDASLEPSGTGTRMSFAVQMEVLGRLATLGAAPMRRRVDEIFGEFVRRVNAELGKTGQEAASAHV